MATAVAITAAVLSIPGPSDSDPSRSGGARGENRGGRSTGSNSERKAKPFHTRRISAAIFGRGFTISEEEIDSVLKNEAAADNPALLASLYAISPDSRILQLIDKLPPSRDACLVMSLCLGSPEEKLKWLGELEKLGPLDAVSRNAKAMALIEAGRREEATELLATSTAQDIAPSSALSAVVHAERDLWSMLGESDGEALELAGNSGVVKKFLTSVSSGIQQLAEGDTAGEMDDQQRLAFVNQSMESLSALDASLGENIPFNLSKAIERTELRALEVLDPEVSYGNEGKVRDRIAELKRSIAKSTQIENEISMELRDANPADLTEYYKKIASEGFSSAGSWLLRKDLSK